MESKLVLIKSEMWRIWDCDNNGFMGVNCNKKSMPIFLSNKELSTATEITDSALPKIRTLDELSPVERKIAIQRYTVIAGVLSVLSDIKSRNNAITRAAEQWSVSKQTVRTYLYNYLVYQDIASLAPKPKEPKALSPDEKNFRWALNRFFYTRNKNSLKTAYTMMLKAKYCEPNGQLKTNYPSFNQFRYFYSKTKKLENYYISRDGLTEYQKNKRPLTGDRVQEFAPNVGTAMLDSTVCDIYLINDLGQLVGRPILIAACDANTSLCLGYALLLEGGTYSLKQLVNNIITDKVNLCERMGIKISREQWSVDKLPGIMVTDRGKEYIGQTFEQISELGVTLINLPPYRPDLKGPIEKLFSLIQDSYKDVLKGKGVIQPDFQERGAKDYRKEACLTIEAFEKIVVKCIVYYNCNRLIKTYPYTPEMIALKIKPYASAIWNYKANKEGANLIKVSEKELNLILLPRTKGKFTRFGLVVNQLRYYADGYKENYLKGEMVNVAYNPDSCDKIWLIENNGAFIEFHLIESRFSEMDLKTVNDIKKQQNSIVQNEIEQSLKSKIELMSYIESISNQTSHADISIKNVKKTRLSTIKKDHRITEV